LRIALKATEVISPIVEGAFAVVSEWRMTQIVCQTRKIHYIGVEP
jgi:NAD(P)H-dependent flavin oxidoreductase YrpB (nitropropane dioxygenase family)